MNRHKGVKYYSTGMSFLVFENVESYQNYIQISRFQHYGVSIDEVSIYGMKGQ